MGSNEPRTELLAILPLRNAVLFPMSVVPINVGRPRSVRLVEELASRERALVGVVSQRNTETVEPTFDDVHTVGTLARVVKVIRLGQSNYSVVLNGLSRFRIAAPVGLEPYMQAEVERIREHRRGDEDLAKLTRRLRDCTREVLNLMPDLPKETAGILDNVNEAGALADLIASNFSEDQAQVLERQQILEAFDIKARVSRVLAIVERQLLVLRKKDAITEELRDQMTVSQREFVLREQMRTILEELGEAGEEDEVDSLRNRIIRAELPKEALDAAKKQLSRLKAMQPQSAEYNVTRNYVEWLSDLPWSRTTADQVDVLNVRRCLDEDHHGLETVKRRVVEYAAIRQLRKDKRGPILLFVGPPGVGKTSLGRSIARAMGRRYGRIALGGVRDEAEIRGHRRTYVGALPGRIIQALKKVGTRNPVLVLDEIDKMGADMRGDPASALLEVLDPAQNDTFVDHYIDVPFDLSQVIFLATANDRSQIPGPLRDRMEVIEVPGYTRNEKFAIAEQFLVPKQLRDHGLTEELLEFTGDGLAAIVDHYTREPGVRSLEREIGAVCRDTAVKLAEGTAISTRVADAGHVEVVLGVRRYHPEIVERRYLPGIATGLSATGAGGDLLLIEATQMPGKGDIRVTGNMRTIMKESAMTAVSYVRSRADRLHLDPEWLKSIDLHLHAPRGRAAQDAAGAGVTMFVAVVSLLLGIPTRPDVAVTGELTLRGRVLRIGETKAKILAAHRAGIRRVLLPKQNLPDLEEVPAEVLREIEITPVAHVDEVLKYVFDRVDTGLREESGIAPALA
jgi:ATP-dependent Lon protease